MMHALLLQRIAEGYNRMLLPDHLGELSRSPLTGQGLVTHLQDRGKMVAALTSLFGARINRYGCFLPDLTGFTIYRHHDRLRRQ